MTVFGRNAADGIEHLPAMARKERRQGTAIFAVMSENGASPRIAAPRRCSHTSAPGQHVLGIAELCAASAFRASVGSWC
jgi:hypothetical protein